MEEFCKFYADKSQKLLFTEILEKRKRAVDKVRRHINTTTGQSEITEDNFLKVVNAGHLGFMAKQVDAEFFQVQTGHFFIQMARQCIDLIFVFFTLGP